MPYKPSNSVHVNNYMKKAYDRISIVVPKGTLDAYKQFAAERGMSVNALFNTAVNELLLRNGAEIPKGTYEKNHRQD